MSWHLGRMTPFDLETTSPDPEQARIVEAYIGRVHNGSGHPPFEPYLVLVNPGVEIPAEASAIHHYDTAYLREFGQDAAASIEEIAARLAASLLEGIPIVGHNVGTYDLTVIDRECRRYGLATLADRTSGVVSPVLDTKILSKHVDPYRRRVSQQQGAQVLKTCAEVFRIPWSDDAAHGARYDALISARVAWRMGAIAVMPKDQRPKLASNASRDLFDHLAVPLSQLCVSQERWAAEQAASYADYLRKLAGQAQTPDEQAALTAQAEGVRGDWPIVPYARQEALS